MKISSRVALLFCLCTATTVSAFWPFGGVTKRSYTIHGYLDHAPKGVAALDQVDLTTADGKARALVIDEYMKPGDVPPIDGRISRDPNRNFSLRGGREEVSRLISAPPGAEVQGTFIVSDGSPASLQIAELTQP